MGDFFSNFYHSVQKTLQFSPLKFGTCSKNICSAMGKCFGLRHWILLVRCNYLKITNVASDLHVELTSFSAHRHRKSFGASTAEHRNLCICRSGEGEAWTILKGCENEEKCTAGGRAPGVWANVWIGHGSIIIYLHFFRCIEYSPLSKRPFG